MRPPNRVRPCGPIAAAVVLLTTLAACSSSGATPQAISSNPTPSTSSRTSTSTSVVAPPTSSVPTSSPPSPPSSSSSPSSSSPSTSVGPARRQLPRGGTRIFPDYRLVAYYGGPDGPGLGALGDHAPDVTADAIEQRAASYARYGRRVQPAMELIATVAQGAPGPDGTYSRAIRDDQIATYLSVAHAHKMLLILDIQPGGGEFLPQVQRLRQYLLDPSVSVALDPEWKVPPGTRPGNGRIGSSSAASINAVGDYLSRLVTDHNLPDKLLVIHQFTSRMLPDRQNIVQHRGIESVLHADGESSPAEKVAVYHQLRFPVPPFHAGFKVFFTEDTRLMSPTEVMRLRPQPEMITYQ